MTSPRPALLLIAGIAIACVRLTSALAQSPPPVRTYTYEVASIHQSDPAEQNVHMGNDGPRGGLRTINTSIRVLIGAAYNVQDYQIIGAPAWTSSRHFDVILTPEETNGREPSGSPDSEQESFRRNMQRLQAVLRDRCGLVLRAETRQLPVYSLTQAKGGRKLSPHAEENGPRSISTNGDRQIKATDATMDMLAEQLSMQLGRPVHNDTSLEGHYDLRLDWIPDMNTSREAPR